MAEHGAAILSPDDTVYYRTGSGHGSTSFNEALLETLLGLEGNKYIEEDE